MHEILEFNTENTLNILSEILEDGKDVNNLLWEIIKYVKDVLLYKSTSKTEMYNDQEIEQIKELAEKISKQELIDLICELFEIENNMKLSTQKLIILQAGLIKLCNKEKVNTPSNSNNGNIDNSELERRVTKIENFLRAGNFAKATKSTSKNSEPQNKKEEKIVATIKPKYEGKTQDYWPKLIEDFKKSGKMVMFMNLKGSVAREINDMTLEIEFPNGLNNMAKEFLSRPDTKQNLRETVHLASGKEMQIKFAESNNQKDIAQVNEFERFIGDSDIPFNVI